MTAEPLNAETRLEAQLGVLTPNPAFYVRDHFPLPQIDVAAWRLTLDGEMDRPLALTYDALRLVVPGWYGVAAVKRLLRITALAAPVSGFSQRERYVMAHPERGETTVTPLTAIPPRSLLVAPADGARLSQGTQRLRGLAWSGQAPVERVEASVDDGQTWRAAAWTSEPAHYAWRAGVYRWEVTHPGPAALRSRAIDAAGHTQPAAADWNRLGYANNAIQVVRVTVA